MIEYLIRPTDDEWFDLYTNHFAVALRPSSLPSHRIEGWGDWRIQSEGCDIAFSLEDPGIQVVFEGDLSSEIADRIVDEIRRNIELATGQRGRVVRL